MSEVLKVYKMAPILFRENQRNTMSISMFHLCLWLDFVRNMVKCKDNYHIHLFQCLNIIATSEPSLLSISVYIKIVNQDLRKDQDFRRYFSIKGPSP